MGDLLIVMVNFDDKETNDSRFSGSTEKQCIQYDGKGHTLYSANGTKYICENRNLDICVSDYRSHRVVVVNRDGKLIFKYSGTPYKPKKLFKPLRHYNRQSKSNRESRL